MALISCTECEEKVSSLAEACPKCGALVAPMIDAIMARRKPSQPAKTRTGGKPSKGAIIMLFIGAVVLTVPLLFISKPTEKELFADTPGIGHVNAPDFTLTPTEQADKQFSGWDGSHSILTRRIKDRMDDPSSYEHVETKQIVTDEGVVIHAKFRGKNKFGVLVLSEVEAVASLDGRGLDVVIVSWQ